jgi:hypothetical protein
MQNLFTEFSDSVFMIYLRIDKFIFTHINNIYIYGESQ